MEHFYIYSFTLAVIPLLLGLLFIWFGKKLWDNATKKNEEYQQRYTGRTTLRDNKVEKKNGKKPIPTNKVQKAGFLLPLILRSTNIR